MPRDPTQTPRTTPAAEIAIGPALVADLLAAQHPDLAALPLRALDAGWDNALFRLGEHLAVRLPRRRMAATLIEHEQSWLPELADRLPLPVPAPVRRGVPGCGYPWHWSVLPWLPGSPADSSPPAASEAPVLAEFLNALHVPAPPSAPHNPYRGVPLADRRETVTPRLERLAGHPAVTAAVREAWQAGLDAAPAATACWVHGDLHARNVLVASGRLAAVIDWGDICRGDPATDLAAVWMLLDSAEVRRQCMSHYRGAGPADWQRARGWAVSFGTVLLETGLADNPRHAAMGETTLRRLAED